MLIYRCIFPLSFSGRLEFNVNGKIVGTEYIQYCSVSEQPGRKGFLNNDLCDKLYI